MVTERILELKYIIKTVKDGYLRDDKLCYFEKMCRSLATFDHSYQTHLTKVNLTKLTRSHLSQFT